MLGVEMASTGEVGCIAETMHEALLLGLEATGFRCPRRGVLLSLGPEGREVHVRGRSARHSRRAASADLRHRGHGRDAPRPRHRQPRGRKSDHDPESAVRAIEHGVVDLVINIPRTYDAQGRPDGYAIRRAAIDAGVPLVTDPQLARTIIEMLRRTGGKAATPRAMTDYVRPAAARLTRLPARAS